MLIKGETVSFERDELKVLLACASKPPSNPETIYSPNLCAVGLASAEIAYERVQIAWSSNGHRIVRAVRELRGVDGDVGLDMAIPYEVVKAAIALCPPDGEVEFLRGKRDTFVAGDLRVTWRDRALVVPYTADTFVAPGLLERRMPLCALDGEYLSDAKLLGRVTADGTITIVTPRTPVEAIHIMCQHDETTWHYCVMPRATEEAKDAARQLSLWTEPERVDQQTGEVAPCATPGL